MTERRTPTEDIVAAYEATGSVWDAGRRVGLAGQSVWERLRAIGHPLRARRWTAEELDFLRNSVATHAIGEMAHQLGRPYDAVALKISRLGLAGRGPRSGGRQRKLYTKRDTTGYVKLLRQFKGSLRQFAMQHGLSIDLLANTLQARDPEWWTEYSKSKGLAATRCPYCDTEFYPVTKKQRYCTRKCTSDARRDAQYFGGRRREAIGLKEGICQLCRRQVRRGLAAHHVYGKENDPDNAHLVALCPGCHKAVSLLATRAFFDSEEGWQDLIQLVLARRLADQEGGPAGAHVCVDIDFLTEADLTRED